jgi:hypothetical protein
MTADNSFDGHGSSSVSHDPSLVSAFTLPETWAQLYPSLGPPSTTTSADPTLQQGSRASGLGQVRKVTHHHHLPFLMSGFLIGQILQRAFSQISGDSIMSEFMNRIRENQRRGNPPASEFAIKNLEGTKKLARQTCTICQVFYAFILCWFLGL